MTTVLIMDGLHPVAKEILVKHGIFADEKKSMPHDELVAHLHEEQYDGLIVRSKTKMSQRDQADAILAVESLKVIGRAGSGVDNIDVEQAANKGVQVMNAPGANAIAVAELVVFQMGALARSLTTADRSTRSGLLEKSRFQGTNLAGKTIGIVGIGHIGFEVAKRAQAFGMNILAFDPHLTKNRKDEISTAAPHTEFVMLNKLVECSDFITLHTPMLKSEILDAEAIDRMKTGVFVINTARKGLINEGVLKEAIRDGHVAGAALDVFTDLFHKDPTFTDKHNVILTPHIGASTAESQRNVAAIIATQVKDFLLGKEAVNPVNRPAFLRRDEALRALRN